MKKGGECVKVAIRCRPLSSQEKLDNRKIAVHITPERGEVLLGTPNGDPEENRNFTFDIVCPPTITQEACYNQTALPIVESVLEGYNGTIFAYGQTGTGKTHTMEGLVEPPALRGIIPRAFEHVFRVIEGTPNKQFLVRASYLELYNEEVRDLLHKNQGQKLELKEKPDSGVYVKDLSGFVIQNPDEMKQKLALGKSNRAVGETKMNRDSSRSHSIFIITIEMSQVYQDGETHIRAGKLNLVDLAGSERQSKTQATGDRFKEAININQSLTSLGNVISSLVDQKSTHIPYRDSKLTRLLQDSLGGNTKTVMIANVGPADYNYDETLSTLRYANRAKSIKNKPKINEDPKDTMIREYQEEIDKLKSELAKKVGGDVQADGTVRKIIEVEKIVKIDNSEKVLELERKLQKEKEEIQKKHQEERRRIEQEMNMAQEQKDKLLQELQNQEDFEEQNSREQEELLKRLQDMQGQLLKGDQMKQKQREQEKALLQARLELEERQQQERRLAEELAKREALEFDAKKNYLSLKDEIDAKNKKLSTLINRMKEAKSQSSEIHQYRQREKEILLDENRNVIRELKLINLIIEHFIPQEEVKKLESKLEYSEEMDDWTIKDLQNDEIKVKRPGSSLGLKRPMCEFARMAISFGDGNPRFRADNILQLDLDLPERTTEDFDGNVSQKLQETINIALNEDEEEMQMISQEKMPNVYIENPDLISKENVLNSKPKRLQSAKKQRGRPQSGYKKH